MKINLLILFCLSISCCTPTAQFPKNIITKDLFTTVLKEVHLAEATYELNKSKGMEQAQNILAISYSEIYKLHNIKKEDFTNTLSYYANYPEELEVIYSELLKGLIEEQSTLNLQ